MSYELKRVSNSSSSDEWGFGMEVIITLVVSAVILKLFCRCMGCFYFHTRRASPANQPVIPSKKIKHSPTQPPPVDPNEKMVSLCVIEVKDCVRMIKKSKRHTYSLDLLLKALDVESYLNEFDSKEEWVKQQVREYSLEVKKLREIVPKLKVVWVTGNRSPALIGIDRVAKFVGAPALLPIGELLKWNIAPFTGELREGIDHINDYALSGSMFSYCTPAYDYATEKHFIFNPQIELQRILGSKYFSKRLKIAVLRLIHSNADAAILKQAREHIEQYIQKTASTRSILDLFDTEQALELSEQEHSFLTNSFPLIWGTTSKKLLFSPVRSDIHGEYAYKGVLKLGEDINVVFTEQAKVPLISQWLHEHKLDSVKVISFGAMGYFNFLSFEKWYTKQNGQTRDQYFRGKAEDKKWKKERRVREFGQIQSLLPEGERVCKTEPINYPPNSFISKKLVTTESNKYILLTQETQDKKPDSLFALELKLTQVAAKLQVSPQLVAYDTNDQRMLFDYVVCQKWPSYSENAMPYHEAMHLLKLFHENARTLVEDQEMGDHFSPFSPFSHVIDRGRKLIEEIPSLSEHFGQAIDRVELILRTLMPWLKKNATYCHGDFRTRALLYNGERVFLDKWENAKWGDPFLDVVTFSSVSSVFRGTKYEFYKAYIGQDPTSQEMAHFELMNSVLFVKDVVHKIDLECSYKSPSEILTQKEMEIALDEARHFTTFSSYDHSPCLGASEALAIFLQGTNNDSSFSHLLEQVSTYS